MGDNYVVDFLVKKGEAIGLMKGEKRGERKGLQKGVLLEAVQSVIKVLSVRFGKVPARLQKRIDGIKDRKVLESLLARAVICKCLESFQKRLK